VIEVQTQLQEYEDLFPTRFLELKDIKGDLGEMKIQLNLDSRPIKYRPYRLNPIFKEKVKKEIERMIEARMIFPIDKVEWIIHIVVQTKKGIYDIRVCADYIILNATFVHDPFLTAFSDEVLDQVAGNEAYSFTNDLFRYHQV
jgi:hypothetical protein